MAIYNIERHHKIMGRGIQDDPLPHLSYTQRVNNYSETNSLKETSFVDSVFSHESMS